MYVLAVDAGQTDKNETEVKVQITGAYMSIKMFNLHNTGSTEGKSTDYRGIHVHKNV